MVMGHYATALIPYAYDRNRQLAPFWVFLLASQVLDFIMVLLVAVGIERIDPERFIDASFLDMSVDMTYSHDLLPVLVLSIACAILAAAVFKSLLLGLWVFSLMIVHELLDLIVGFKHYWFGPGEESFGTGMYNVAPVAGLLIESLLCFLIVTWFIRKRRAAGKPLSGGKKIALYLILVGLTLGLLPMANQSLSALFG